MQYNTIQYNTIQYNTKNARNENKGSTVYTGFWCGNLREREHLGDPGVDGRIILRWVFRRWDMELWTRSSWPRIGKVGGQL